MSSSVAICSSVFPGFASGSRASPLLTLSDLRRPGAKASFHAQTYPTENKKPSIIH